MNNAIHQNNLHINEVSKQANTPISSSSYQSNTNFQDPITEEQDPEPSQDNIDPENFLPEELEELKNLLDG